MSNFNETSSTGYSKHMNSELEYKDASGTGRSMIEKYHNQGNRRCGFGSSIKRFDSKQDLKQYFNMEPGPGTYAENSDSIKDKLLKNDTTMSTRNYNVSASYSQSFSAERSQFDKNSSSPGFGSKGNRFKNESKLREEQTLPGPGAYNYKNTLNNRGGLINPKPTVSLNFNENNPLNYVRPITVNLYFKQDNPPVGKYDAFKEFGSTNRNV